MGLLATCPRCKTTYVGGQACPGCNYREGDAEEGEATDLVAEYASRRTKHTVAYAAYMIRGLAGGILGILPVVWCWAGLIPVVVLIGVAILAGTISQFVLFAYRDYRELKCPNCDTRLDEIPIDYGRCPGCQARLL